MAKQLTLIVHIRVKPEDAEKLVELHKPVWAACAAETECIFFDVFQDPEDRGSFRFVEVWSESREWFEQVQFKKPYYAPLWEKTRPLWTEEAKIEYLQRFGEGSIFRQAYLDGGKKMD